MLPGVAAGLVDAEDIVVNAVSGVSGAGRALKEGSLFSEAAEGVHAYAIGGHRHMAELDQEVSAAGGKHVTVSFTPHLVPMVRGELVTCTVRLAPGTDVDGLRDRMAKRYADEPFVVVLPAGRSPDTRHARGSNLCILSVHADRRPGYAIIIGAIDNLVKGSAGQAVQNFNLMAGYPETTGLGAVPLYP